MATGERSTVRPCQWPGHAQYHRQRRLSAASAATSAACSPDPVRPPLLLDDDQRRARIQHAMAHSLQSWEIAVLVGGDIE